MGLLYWLFSKQHDRQEEKPAEYNVMYPKIEVVDSDEWKKHGDMILMAIQTLKQKKMKMSVQLMMSGIFGQ